MPFQKLKEIVTILVVRNLKKDDLANVVQSKHAKEEDEEEINYFIIRIINFYKLQLAPRISVKWRN